MPVTYEIRDHVAVLSIDDGKANVVTHELLAELHAHLDRAGADPEVGSVLLAGRPGRFSAGFDLSTMTGPGEGMRALVIAGGRFLARLLLEPKPVVAACTGHALAAGALMLLASDHRVAAAGAFKIGLNEVAIGMPLPRYGVELARYRVAPSHFDWSVVLGQVSDPEGARQAGFVDRVVEPEAVLEEGFGVAATLAGLQTRAVEGTKRRARQAVAERMVDGIDGDVASINAPTPT